MLGTVSGLLWKFVKILHVGVNGFKRNPDDMLLWSLGANCIWFLTKNTFVDESWLLQLVKETQCAESIFWHCCSQCCTFFSNERPPEDDIITSPTKMNRLFYHGKTEKTPRREEKRPMLHVKQSLDHHIMVTLLQSVSLFFYCWRKLRRPAPSQLLGFVLVPLMFRSVPSLMQKSFWKCKTLLEKFILGKICNFFQESIRKFTSFPFWHWMTQLIHGALAVVPSSDVVYVLTSSNVFCILDHLSVCWAWCITSIYA